MSPLGYLSEVLNHALKRLPLGGVCHFVQVDGALVAAVVEHVHRVHSLDIYPVLDAEQIYNRPLPHSKAAPSTLIDL